MPAPRTRTAAAIKAMIQARWDELRGAARRPSPAARRRLPPAPAPAAPAAAVAGPRGGRDAGHRPGGVGAGIDRVRSPAGWRPGGPGWRCPRTRAPGVLRRVPGRDVVGRFGGDVVGHGLLLRSRSGDRDLDRRRRSFRTGLGAAAEGGSERRGYPLVRHRRARVPPAHWRTMTGHPWAPHGVHRAATAFSGAAAVYEQARPATRPRPWPGWASTWAWARDAGSSTSPRARASSPAGLSPPAPTSSPWSPSRACAGPWPRRCPVPGGGGRGPGHPARTADRRRPHRGPGHALVRHRSARRRDAPRPAPGSRLAVVWNRRDLSDPCRPRCTGSWRRCTATRPRGPRASGAASSRHAERRPPRVRRPTRSSACRGARPIDVEGVAGRVASVSFVAGWTMPSASGCSTRCGPRPGATRPRCRCRTRPRSSATGALD